MRGHRDKFIFQGIKGQTFTHEQDTKVQGGGVKDKIGELGYTPDKQLLEVNEVTIGVNFPRGSSGKSASESYCRSSSRIIIRELSFWGPTTLLWWLSQKGLHGWDCRVKGRVTASI